MIVDKDPNNNWGEMSLNGSRGPEDIGVQDRVFNGDYDMSLGPWTWTKEREALADFPLGMFTTKRRMATNFNRVPIDFTLFTRPFSARSWAFMSGCALLLTLSLASTIFIGKDLDLDKRASLRISKLSCWLFFLLLNAFYSAALTMFFSSPSSVPFHTLEEGVNAPAWKFFIIRESYYYLLIYPQSDGMPGGLTHVYEKLMETIDESSVENTEEAVDKLVNEPGTFYFPDEVRLTYYLKHNQRGDVTTFGEGLRQSWTLMLANDSPYRRMFYHGFLGLQQSGAMDQILQRWIGKLQKEPTLETTKLAAGHVALVFFILLWAYVLSIVILIIECLYRKPKLGKLKEKDMNNSGVPGFVAYQGTLEKFK